MGNLISRAWRRLAAPGADAAAAAETDAAGTAEIGSCRDREKVILHGTLSEVTTVSCDGTPSLRAQLADGSGSVTLVWLGRNEIPGIETGRRVRIVGRIGSRGERRVIYNPRYELLPGSP